MARPFQIALESSDLEGAVSESENSELTVSDVIEDDAASDEAAEIQEDINRDSDALEELTEEVGVLADQVEKNEEKLENPEEVVAADVVVSEESLRDSMVRVGYTDGLNDRISFASESTYESLKMNPARHLSISNEGVKDFMAKVISNVKTLIIRIINASKKLFQQLLLKFGNYEKKLNMVLKQLMALDTAKISSMSKDFIDDRKQSYVDAYPHFYLRTDDSCLKAGLVTSIFGKMETAIKQHIEYALGKKDDMPTITIVNAGDVAYKYTQDNVIKHISSDQKENLSDMHTTPLLTVIGNTAWFYLNPTEGRTKVLESVTFKVEPSELNFVRDFQHIIKCVPAAVGAVRDRKKVFDAFNKAQNSYLADINKVESEYKKAGNKSAELKKVINELKVVSTQINLLLVKGFVDGIKRTAVLANKFVKDFSYDKDIDGKEK